MAGLLDFSQYDDPEKAAQLAFGAAMLEAGGPQRFPVSTGQALAQAMMLGRNTATLAGESRRRNALTESQIAHQRMQQRLLLEQLQRQQQADAFYSNPENFMRVVPPMRGAPGEGETPTAGGQVPLSQQEIAMNMARAPSPDIRKLGIAALVKPPGADASAPASVREWEYFSKLSPSEQNRFMELRRQMYQAGTIGDVPTLIPRSPGLAPQPLSTIEAETTGKRRTAQAKSEGTKIGENLAQDKRTLDDMKYAYPTLESEIRKIQNHPGLPLGTGVLNWTTAVPGTPMANFVAMHNKLRGTVFLEAFKTLKGGGQITEIEGEKAEAAMIRMDRAQTAAAYREGLEDFLTQYRTGMQKMQKRVDFPGGYADPTDQANARYSNPIPGEKVNAVPGAFKILGVEGE